VFAGFLINIEKSVAETPHDTLPYDWRIASDVETISFATILIKHKHMILDLC
jgi:hypothetical protein